MLIGKSIYIIISVITIYSSSSSTYTQTQTLTYTQMNVSSFLSTDSEVANLYDLTSDKHNYIVISEHSNCSQGCGGESSKRGMDRNVLLVLSIQEASCPLTTSGLGFSVGPLAFHFQRRSPFESRTKAKTLKEEKEKEREKREEPPFISHY